MAQPSTAMGGESTGLGLLNKWTSILDNLPNTYEEWVMSHFVITENIYGKGIKTSFFMDVR